MQASFTDWEKPVWEQLVLDSLCLQQVMILELIQMTPERHVIADNEIFAADLEQLAEWHTCKASANEQT